MIEEENFPRGGKIVLKRAANLFGVTESPKPKKARKGNKKQISEVFQTLLPARGSLTYNKIQTGMVILGCVRHIKNVQLEVELPGLCFVSLNITEISDPFTKYLNQLLESKETDTEEILSKVFKIGEYLPVKILNVKTHDEGYIIEGTTNPREIYSELRHDSFKKGMLTWGSISSESDHGYEVNIGVKNCRVFLPLKNIDEGFSCLIGKPLWCVVHKNDWTVTSSILRVSTKTEHVNKAIEDVDNLNGVIPGAKVEFLTEKIAAHGLQGKFSENFVGYVDENYLKNPLEKPSNYHEGQVLPAHVLYTEPVSKLTHLSLCNLEMQEKPEGNIGDVLTGTVFSRSFNGIFFSFENNQKGFVTNKRLLNTLPKRGSSAGIGEGLNSKYSVGSKHRCRILDYNRMLRAFICTPEVAVVKQPVFTLKDLEIGQLIDVSVSLIKDEGLVVAAGLVKGFVPNLHIADAEYSDRIKKKYKERQKISARVLSIDEANKKVLFTIKPSLVKSDKPLTKLQEAEIGKNYTGVVAKLGDKGALVVFFGGVKGWINFSKKEQQSMNSKYFFLGQVVNVYIRKIEGENVFLSLLKPQMKSSCAKVGSKCYAVVSSVVEEGVHVNIENSDKQGLIPNSHLSSSLGLCKAIKGTFHPGDKLTELLYIGGKDQGLYSKREALIFEYNKVPRLEDLKRGSIVRCSFHSKSDEGMYVLPLIWNYNEMVLVLNKDVSEKIISSPLMPYQALLAKVVNIKREEKEIQLSITLETPKQKVEDVISSFTHFLSDLFYLKEYGTKHGWDICSFKVGNQVTCRVVEVDDQGGCMVSLPNDVRGFAVPFLCPRKIEKGKSLKGTVIAHDFERRSVEVCLRQDVCSKINTSQDGTLKAPVVSCMAEKLLVKEEHVVVVLKHPDANRQLVYLPLRGSENDITGYSSYYKEKQFKVCVCSKAKGQLIGMSKRLFLKLDRKTKKEAKGFGADQQHKEEIPQEPAADSDSGIEHNKDIDVDVSSEDETRPTNRATITLPGISSFFSSAKREVAQDSSSEDDDHAPVVKRKKKLSPAERAELLKQEEERVSKIEKELADSFKVPESAKEFDRLVLHNPDSSELWIKYVSFHIAATEIDKARAVAKRALDTINMTCTQEKFNIWVLLLNLESTFGTQESFDKVLEEALKFNDSLQIYLKAIQIFAQDGKYAEMEKHVKIIRNKHKKEPMMWIELAKTYYQMGKFKEARNCKDSALKSIENKKTQMSLIIRFAILEFKYGEEDQGCAIFETVLSLDFKKVNVWLTYIDQLTKKGSIEQARQVLRRAVNLKLPLKSTKTLFVKFRKFEEAHGTQESVEAVKKKAQQYVTKFQ